MRFHAFSQVGRGEWSLANNDRIILSTEPLKTGQLLSKVVWIYGIKSRAQLNVLAKPASWIAVFSFVFFSFCAESSPRRGEPTLTNRNPGCAI
jgi:hypothetical protein